MKFKSELEYQEFIKQYAETWLRLRSRLLKSNQWQTAYFYASRRGDGNPRTSDLDRDAYGLFTIGGKDMNLLYADIEVDTNPPEVGLYQIKHTVCLFERTPNRQWKWGISAQNSHITPILTENIDLTLRKLSKLYVITLPASADCGGRLSVTQASTVEALLFPPAPLDFVEACEIQRKNTQIATVINREFALSASPSISGFILWRFQIPCGIVDDETYNIKVTNPLFYQEISDFLARTGQHDIQCYQ